MLWCKMLTYAKRFETKAEAEAALEKVKVGDEIHGCKVVRKAVGADKNNRPIVIADMDDDRRFFPGGG